MKKTLLVLPFAFIALVLTHAQSRVAGTWQNEVLSGPALQLWTVELSQDGTSVTGTVAWGGASTEIDEGTIDGDAVVFTFTSPDGERTITLTGDVNGDEIAFTRDVEVREGGSPGFGLFGVRGAPQFTLRRVPDGQAPAQPRGLPYPRQLTMFNRQGEVVRLVGEPGNFNQPVLSPDGTRMAVVEDGEIWVFNLSDDTRIQLTSTFAGSPVWSEDGTQIAFFSFRENYGGLYRIPSDGSGTEELLYQHTLGAGMNLTDWSADGRFLSFHSGGVLYAVRLDGDVPSEPGDAIEFPRTEFDQMAPRLSPNSRFLAYRSNESGRNEVHVRPFDPSATGAVPTGKWQISDQGGLGMVHWRQDGQELYYLGGDGGVMAVDVTMDPFTAGAPRRLFLVPDTVPLLGPLGEASGGLGSMSGDGQRIVFAVPQPPDRRDVTVAPKILSRYTGIYENVFLLGVDLEFTLEDNRLWMDASSSEGKAPMLAESETSFYFKQFNFEIDFVTDDQGNVPHLTFYNLGTGLKWTRK